MLWYFPKKQHINISTNDRSEKVTMTSSIQLYHTIGENRNGGAVEIVCSPSFYHPWTKRLVFQALLKHPKDFQLDSF